MSDVEGKSCLQTLLCVPHALSCSHLPIVGEWSRALAGVVLGAQASG